MKLVSKPSVESFQRFSEDLVAVLDVTTQVGAQETHLCRNGHP